MLDSNPPTTLVQVTKLGSLPASFAERAKSLVVWVVLPGTDQSLWVLTSPIVTTLLRTHE